MRSAGAPHSGCNLDNQANLDKIMLGTKTDNVERESCAMLPVHF